MPNLQQKVEAFRLNYGGGAMHIDAALIDMDGVLYDSMKYHTLAWQRMVSELGIACTRDEFYLYEGMTGYATINLIFQRAYGRSATQQEAKDLYEIKSRYFRELGRRELMPGAADMLGALMEAGVTRVLVTGSGQASLLDELSADYPGAFLDDKRVTAHDVKHGKPDPEPYLMGLCKAGSRPENTIVIENAPLGVQAGHAAGCFTIGVTTGPIPAETMCQAGADMVYSSMEEFAAALPQILSTYPPSHE